MASPQDPRRIITPASFAVAPELVGLPLASAWRRAAAMLVDLFAVALLTNAGSVFFGIVGAIVLLRASARPAERGLRRWMRGALRLGGALVLFVVIVSAWGFWKGDGREPDGERAEAAGEAAGIALSELGLGPREMIALSSDALALGRARTEEEAQAAADRFAARLKASGIPEERLAEIRDELRIADEGSNAHVVRALRQAFGAADAADPPAPTADSLARAYVTALDAGDSAAIADLRTRLGEELSADEVAALRRQIARLRQSRNALEEELKELHERSAFRQAFGVVVDEIGLGIGWLGLYFTALTALWRGQTVGKWLLRIRVIRLDGKPMGWWLALERFGGYTAGLFTGMLGFVQIFWDRNRQGIHDKITETVVIRVTSRTAPQQPGSGGQAAAHGALHGG